MDANSLKARIVGQGLRMFDVYDRVNISRSAWCRKMSGQSDFTRREISEIADMLHLNDSEIVKIFFAQEVS